MQEEVRHWVRAELDQSSEALGFRMVVRAVWPDHNSLHDELQ
jgi:hypothetical protein